MKCVFETHLRRIVLYKSKWVFHVLNQVPHSCWISSFSVKRITFGGQTGCRCHVDAETFVMQRLGNLFCVFVWWKKNQSIKFIWIQFSLFHEQIVLSVYFPANKTIIYQKGHLLLQKPVNPASPKLEHQSHTTLVIGFGGVGDDHRSVGCALCSVQQ